jgi:hypothetical protein
LQREPSARALRSRRRLARTVALGAVVAALFAGCAYPGPARSECAGAVLDDWTTGTLDSTYPQDCYHAAIDALPEDLRAYTSAAQDISRAAIAANRAEASRVDAQGPARQVAAAPVESDDARAFPVAVVLLVAFVIVLAAAGLAGSAVRRRRLR